MPTINYYAIRTFLATDQDDVYTIDFPFLERHNIAIFQNGATLNHSTSIEWISTNQFKITSPVVINDTIVIRRYTRQDIRLADYHNGSTLTEQELNLVTKQLLYLIQELSDYRTAGHDPDPPPGQTGDPTDPDDPDLIDNIITELMATQLFQNLIALIPLIDINAEAIISNTLNNHNDWVATQILDNTVEQHGIDLTAYGIHLDTIDAQIIDLDNTIVTETSALAVSLSGVAARVDDAEANVLSLQTAYANLDSALATNVTQLQAEIAANEAYMLNVETASVTADTAMTARVNLMESTFNSDIAAVNSRIGNVETTYVSEAEAGSLILTEINTWYSTNDFEPMLSSSNYINGISTAATANTADISAITSFLIGTNADFNDPLTWGAGSQASTLAGIQTTVDGHTSLISAESNWRNAMFSAFYPGQDTSDNAGFVAALENTWRTYADEESSIVTRTELLEANQQPIFIRPLPPDPRTPEFAGTRFETGFPRGSVWHDTNVHHRVISYWWEDTNVVPPGIDQVTETISFSGITGMWVLMIDSFVETQGALISTLQSSYSDLEAVGSIVDTVLQSSFGSDFQAVNETIESWFDVQTGHMYSGWQVRINQYNNGVPTIAGIGLGMENDPDNPEAGSESNLIVLADRFSIIRPPTAPEDLNTDLNPEDIFIPFIVNTGSVPGEPDVIISGDMFVKNTLSTMDGFAGRMVFTKLDNNGYPVTRDFNFDATGERLVIASDTNGFNQSNSASPWEGGSNPQKFWIWAGSGTMNHNQATFYVDTDGNAKFDGEIFADNITGDVSNIHDVNVTGGGTASGSGWTVVTLSPWYNPVGTRNRTPTVVVNVDMYGAGQTAGRARIEGQTKVNGIESPWTVIAEAPIYMPIGTTLTLAGSMAPTTGSVRLRSSVQRQETSPGDWQYPSSSYMKGTLSMLS